MFKSINQKAVALSAAMAALAAGCCGIGAWVASDLAGDLELSAHSTRMVQTHMDADMMHDALRADVLAAVVSRDPAFGISIVDVRKELDEHATAFRKDIADNVAVARTDVQKSILDALSEPLEAYISGAEKIVDLIEKKPDEASKALPDFLKEFSTLEGVMSDASAQFETEQNALTAAGQTKGSSAQFLMLTMLGVSILMAGLVTLLVRKSLVNPMLGLAGAMRKLAGGDVTVDVPSMQRSDEIGEMARALLAFKQEMSERQRLEGEAAVVHRKNEEELRRTEGAFRSASQEQTLIIDQLAKSLTSLAAGDLTARISANVSADYQRLKDNYNGAIDKLEQAMKVIAANTRGIRSSTLEISAASDDLSRRTKQQAASLEGTAAALDEITTTMKKSAEGANHAREVVATADSDAKKSAVIVRQAVEAMSAIANSSQQINQIISVIDEIAFQTNLLALNAGVEAARAGDSGRGFAVVASEVRALAQRSAEAAKEIKTLISASTSHVDEGIRLVAETGKSLERIVSQVSEINDVVAGIAAGAKEQAMGLEHVNTAINEMDQVTQQNAAMAGQSTAATHSLSVETSQLSDLVGQFQVAGGGNDSGTMRRELQKVAPHAFRKPATTPSPAKKSAGPALSEVAKPSRIAAGARATSAAPANDDAGWEEF